MPAACRALHHGLELVHLLAELTAGCVVGVRGEEPDRVVAPVVAQSLLDQHVVVDELVHGHELDGRHADPREVVDDGRVRDPGVRAAQRLRERRDAARSAP